MGQWSLYGPDENLLTKAKVCTHLHVSEATLDRLVRDGRFPPPIKHGPKTELLWLALDVACYLHLLSRGTGQSLEISDSEKNS